MHEDHLSEADHDQAWHQSSKGRLVLFTGTMLVLATLIFILARDASFSLFGLQLKVYEIGFAIGALVALAPMAKKAFESAISGRPFTIETLVTLAVIGAIAIEASAEAAVMDLSRFDSCLDRRLSTIEETGLWNTSMMQAFAPAGRIEFHHRVSAARKADA